MEANKTIHKRIINKTINGQLFICNKCNAIHLEFGNTIWKFKGNQFEIFKEYINNINGKYFEIINKDTHYQRKIIMPIDPTNLKIALNIEELRELKMLISDKVIDVTEQLINYNKPYCQQHQLLFLNYQILLHRQQLKCARSG